MPDPLYTCVGADTARGASVRLSAVPPASATAPTPPTPAAVAAGAARAGRVRATSRGMGKSEGHSAGGKSVSLLDVHREKSALR